MQIIKIRNEEMDFTATLLKYIYIYIWYNMSNKLDTNKLDNKE